MKNSKCNPPKGEFFGLQIFFRLHQINLEFHSIKKLCESGNQIQTRYLFKESFRYCNSIGLLV